MSYIKQGEEALKKSMSILGEQDGWKVEIVAVRPLNILYYALYQC